MRDVLKGRKVCEALDHPLGLHNPHLWPEERPEKSLFTDPDTGEQVFTAPNGQTYTRRIPNSHDDRVPECRERGGRGGGGRGAARDCRDAEFFGDADRSAEELVVIRDDIVRHLKDMHKYCLRCGETFARSDAFDAHCQESEDCLQLVRGGGGGTGAAPAGGWGAAGDEEVDLDFVD